MEQYTQIRVLGKGSFGSAWLIQRNADRVQFVAKEIRLVGLKPSERESAKNEIDVLRTLNHPNITKYIDHFEYKGSLFIVMEYANGGDLYMKIKERRGRLFSEKELLHYFSQICLALGYLHERRILHRDLKTQNVFLTKDGIVKLGDFGISTVLRNTYELKRTVCGTPYYFSPELCLSKPYNNKSDVWALGCILYEMTTLNHAFDGTNMKALVQKILKGIYPPINPCYSSNLAKLISAMLQIDPHRRPNVTQILELPFIRDALANLQREVQVAREQRQSVVPEADQVRAQQEAAARREEYQRREQDKEARLEQIQQQQQRQQGAQLEARHRELDNRLKEQRRLQAEAKMNDKDRASAVSAAKRREDEWDRNMKAQAQEERGQREEQQQHRNAAGRSPPWQTPASEHSDAVEAYRERQRQAALNKQRALGDLGAQNAAQRPSASPLPARRSAQSPPALLPNHHDNRNHCQQQRLSPQQQQRSRESSSRASSLNLPADQPPPPRMPPSPHHYSTKKMTQQELGDALAAAYWQMRNESERNKRRHMEHSGSGESPEPSPTAEQPKGRRSEGSAAKPVKRESPAAQAPAPAAETPAPAAAKAARPGPSPTPPPNPQLAVRPDLMNPGDADGEEGFRAFINGDAVVEAEPDQAARRQEDYGALETVIGQALTTHAKPAGDAGDFDDDAFQGDTDPTKFMLDGQAFQLPNVAATDPLMHRIESLRMFLEEKMGDDALIECYRTLNNMSTDDDEQVQKVSEALPADKRRFIPLVMQLIVCEDEFNRQGPGKRKVSK